MAIEIINSGTLKTQQYMAVWSTNRGQCPLHSVAHHRVRARTAHETVRDAETNDLQAEMHEHYWSGPETANLPRHLQCIGTQSPQSHQTNLHLVKQIHFVLHATLMVSAYLIVADCND